jgi:hypothetical protein
MRILVFKGEVVDCESIFNNDTDGQMLSIYIASRAM